MKKYISIFIFAWSLTLLLLLFKINYNGGVGLTELFFTNYSNEHQTGYNANEVSFVVHNLENKSTDYLYNIRVMMNNETFNISQGSMKIQQNDQKIIKQKIDFQNLSANTVYKLSIEIIYDNENKKEIHHYFIIRE